MSILTWLCDECASGQNAGRISWPKNSVATGNHDSRGVCSGKVKHGNVWCGSDLGPVDPKQELVMDSFGYSRCSQCDEEYFLVDGSRCGRCLGLSYVPDDQDNEEESSNISLDRLTAA